MDTIKTLLRSRKFVLALAGALTVILNQVFKWELSQEQVYQILGLLVTVIVGIAYEDGQAKSNGTTISAPLSPPVPPSG